MACKFILISTRKYTVNIDVPGHEITFKLLGGFLINDLFTRTHQWPVAALPLQRSAYRCRYDRYWTFLIPCIENVC
jgi:hypothetical protein